MIIIYIFFIFVAVIIYEHCQSKSIEIQLREPKSIKNIEHYHDYNNYVGFDDNVYRNLDATYNINKNIYAKQTENRKL